MVQVNNTKTVLRLKFYKRGILKYISHLDLVRTMNKVLVRSGLPLWYTEGFNPKPKMVFALPLSIGTSSDCEYLDVRLNERVEPGTAIELVNRNLTKDMQVTEAYYPDSAFTDIFWVSYNITVYSSDVTKAHAEKITEVFSSDDITVLKKTKSGERDVNIAPLIRSCEVGELVEGESLRLVCVLSATQSSFLNPEYIIRILTEKCGLLTNPTLTAERYEIERFAVHREDMSAFI